jgi:hypothetical protein
VRKIHPEEDDFSVVSLGTEKVTRSLPREEVKGWGSPCRRGQS